MTTRGGQPRPGYSADWKPRGRRIFDEAMRRAAREVLAEQPWRPENYAQRRRQQQERADRARATRAAVRATARVVPLTLETLMASQGWTAEYARHLVQPYCSCGPESEGGWFECDHWTEDRL